MTTRHRRPVAADRRRGHRPTLGSARRGVGRSGRRAAAGWRTACDAQPRGRRVAARGPGTADLPHAVLARHRSRAGRTSIRRPSVGHVHAWSRHGGRTPRRRRPWAASRGTECSRLQAIRRRRWQRAGTLLLRRCGGPGKLRGRLRCTAGVWMVRTRRIPGRLPRVAPDGDQYRNQRRAGHRLGPCDRHHRGV